MVRKLTPFRLSIKILSKFAGSESMLNTIVGIISFVEGGLYLSTLVICELEFTCPKTAGSFAARNETHNKRVSHVFFSDIGFFYSSQIKILYLFNE